MINYKTSFRVLILVFSICFVSTIHAQVLNRGISVTVIPASLQISDLNKRYNSPEVPDNFNVKYFRPILPEFSISYLFKENLGKLNFGVSAGHKFHSIKYNAKLTGGDTISNNLLWDNTDKFRYDVLYVEPLVALRLNSSSQLQFGLELSYPYRYTGGFENGQKSSYFFYAVLDDQGEVAYSTTYRVIRNNPIRTNDGIHFSNPKILYLKKINKNLAYQLGLKLNFDKWGRSRGFLSLLEYDELTDEWTQLFEARAKNTMIATIGISYIFRKSSKVTDK